MHRGRLFFLAGMLLASLGASAAGADQKGSAPEGGVSTTRSTDPGVWGVYARMVGGIWAAGYGHTLSVFWLSGDKMQLVDATRRGAQVLILRPTGSGQLRLQQANAQGVTWTGVIGTDGSVTWSPDSGNGTGFRHELLADGALKSETLAFQQGSAPKVVESGRLEARFTPRSVTNAASVPARALPSSSAVAATTTPAPQPATTPDTPESLEAAAAAMQAKANALREAEAAKSIDEQLQADIDAVAAARLVALDAQAAADKAKAAAEAASADAAIADPPKVQRSVAKGGDPRDWWSYCTGREIDHMGNTVQYFITNKIHDRIWSRFDSADDAEYEAYHGPNDSFDVQGRIEKAVQLSGLGDPEDGYDFTCFTYASRDGADVGYRDHQIRLDASRLIIWHHLEDTEIDGSQHLPTPEEVAALRKAAADAANAAAQAKAKAEHEARRLAARREQLQREANCKAGVKSDCGSRGSRQ